jgi:hypothetical protein
MSRSPSDLSGKQFGRLKVRGFSEISRNGHSRWHVVCECGVEKTVLGTHLVQGKTKSCGCLRRRTPTNWTGCGTVSGTYFAGLVRGAAGEKSRKPISFDVTIEFLADLLDNKQNGLCAYTGLPISIRSGTASVDRKDSSKGYIEGNVHWVHKDINMMKRHYTEEYFFYLCSLVHTAGVCEIVDLNAA